MCSKLIAMISLKRSSWLRPGGRLFVVRGIEVKTFKIRMGVVYTTERGNEGAKCISAPEFSVSGQKVKMRCISAPEFRLYGQKVRMRWRRSTSVTDFTAS